LRGIDLLLTEGLNVRVVGLPEGEDPDSYCSKLGGDAFLALLEEKQKNFILFKADLLLSEAADDPLRKADAVRGILESVACIGDGLKRAAMVTELSRVCKMEESMIASELGKLLRGQVLNRKQDLIKEVDEILANANDYAPLREELTDVNQERHLLSVFMKYGKHSFDDTQTVAEVIINEVIEDEYLIFNDPACAVLVEEIRAGLINGHQEPSFFIHHQNQNVSSWAAGELSVNNELSKAYEENLIYVKHEDDNYKQDLTSVLLHLRRKKIDNYIVQKHLSLKEPENDTSDNIQYIMYLDGLKTRIAKDIGMAVDKI